MLQGTESNSYQIKLPVFEGPLDLLLHLIKEAKIDIYDIPIAIITKQYLEYLELMKELNLEIAGDFLVIAATLIYIKSKMLLPPDESPSEEQKEDPRAELVARLLEYQTFKEASKTLREREDLWKNIFYRPPLDEKEIVIEPSTMLFELNLFDLLATFKQLLEKTPEEAMEITRQTLTVKDKINLILERLEREESIRFESFFTDSYTKVAIIVTFLAFLELVRLGLVKAYQEKIFGPIWIINPQRVKTTSTELLPETSNQG
ncbi:MAG TPA: segregation/condensation protein A [Nitrospiraceae bacterium]|nr:segregation/condensation protein A [Nitrospiraceae bacterium]